MKGLKHLGGLASGVGVLAMLLGTSLAMAGPQPSAIGAPRLLPPGSTAYGMTLQQWTGVYWRWFYGVTPNGSDLAHSVINGVQLMPLPVGVQTGGTGTPEDPAVYVGSLSITLKAGTPFVLPEFAWVCERYEGYPAVPDDPPMDNEVALSGVHPTLKIDGQVVLSDINKAAFYVPVTPFDPIVIYQVPSGYGSVAAVSYQGDTVISPPLTPGTHVIHLYETYIIPAGAYPGLPAGYGVIYDNTWTVTVLPPGRS